MQVTPAQKDNKENKKIWKISGGNLAIFCEKYKNLTAGVCINSDLKLLAISAMVIGNSTF